LNNNKRTEEPLQPKAIVAIPAFNEEQYIGGVVLLARQYAEEVIVVDDGSHDRTARMAELAGATVVQHGNNLGYGSAIKTIFSEAKKRDAGVLVVLDADSQHNPDEIPNLISAVSDGFGVVIGSREMQKNNIPTYRRAGQKVLSSLTNLASHSNVVDTESGFRAYSRKAIEKLELKETGMGISAEIVSAATLIGLNITEVPISVRYTKDSSTQHPVKHGLSVMRRIMIIISERRPLLFFGTIGAICVLTGVYFGYLVVKTLYATQIMQTGSALLSMLFITIGVLIISTGLILAVLTSRLEKR